MQSRGFLASHALAALALAFAAGAQVPAYARVILIEYYGDSTVWGFASGGDGAQVARPAPQVFAESLPGRSRFDVRNHGVSGSTACDLLNGTDGRHPPWRTQMKQSGAHFVIFNHAINDQWSVDIPTYRACLRSLARIARASGKRVVFETPNPTRDAGGGLELYVAAMKEVAREEAAPVIDQYGYLTGLLNGRNPTILTPDGLHPSEAVYVLKGTFAAQAFTRLHGIK